VADEVEARKGDEPDDSNKPNGRSGGSRGLRGGGATSDPRSSYGGSLADFDPVKAYRESLARVDVMKAITGSLADFDPVKAYRESLAQVDVMKAYRESLAQVDVMKAYRESLAQVDVMKAYTNSLASLASTQVLPDLLADLNVAGSFGEIVVGLDFSEGPDRALAELEQKVQAVPLREGGLTEADRYAIGAYAGILAFNLLLYFYLVYPGTAGFVLDATTLAAWGAQIGYAVYRRLGDGE